MHNETWLVRAVTTGWMVLAACGGPVAEGGGETEGETETETEADASGSGGATTSSTSTTSTSTSTSTTTTGVDDTSTGADTGTGDDTTGGCPPGTDGCPCDIGSTCEGDLMCVDGTCTAQAPCDQPEAEPNDDEPSAVSLGSVECQSEIQTTEGALDGMEDDWFTFDGTEQGTCLSGQMGVQVVPAQDTPLEVCIYFECLDGSTDVVCPDNTDNTSAEGLAGCCDIGGIDADIDCGFGVDEAGPVYIRIGGQDSDACLPYELNYFF